MLEKILEEINRRIVVSGKKRGKSKIAHAVWAELVDLERWILEHTNKDGWIPCEERLPEVDKDGISADVLVSFSESNYVCIAFYDSNKNCWQIHGPCPYIGEAVAWRPLPEPYRPEKGAEE